MLRMLVSLRVSNTIREPAGKATTTDPCAQHTRANRGGGQLQTTGSQPIELTAYPTCALPEPPSREPHDATSQPRPSAPRALSCLYNTHRPHRSLGWATPTSTLRDNLPAEHI